MTVLVVVLAWIALSPVLALRLGYAIRTNTRIHDRTVRGPHTPTRARQSRSRR